MKEQIINNVICTMKSMLNESQLEVLKLVLENNFENCSVLNENEKGYDNDELLSMFTNAKRVEGCSEKTIRYYNSTLQKLFSSLDMSMLNVETENIRAYLSKYQQETKCSKTNIDNLRRIFSSFFSWLEDENLIVKSPVRRIHKVKSEKLIKETYSDEMMETMRDGCECLRDIAMVDFLSSTGVRVSELVQLDRDDIDFEARECVVFGKGSKERTVYFDARTKVHLKNYLDSRSDDNPALFVSLLKPYKRLEVSGVEIRVRNLGRKLKLGRVHPHKFRRSLATRAIDKGMPVEQVQKLLGHAKIETTMEYAMVDQNNVKLSHKKYLT